ncbi:hypothetical protein ILUMI_26676 [Ignelater luminosus]|uniref:Integrase catalytic domain-containing protein n=1 Tax=Ignelater luminosus TaxID=2038154 RepID=A0A8K0C7K2_IGNLU|nr:hypothetical protein ILUMI_26676 [Ignelater luminosus]
MKIQEVLQDLKGIEVMAGDILVYGSADTIEDANLNHNINLKKLLQRLRECNCKLNKAKLNLCKTSVMFYGHILTNAGLKPDTSKLTVIKEMAEPTSKQELLGYLALVDHYSDYVEINSLKDLTPKSIISCLKTNFSRFGIPETLIADNGFVNSQMDKFKSIYQLTHITLALYHPQKNGKANATVKVIKNITKKCDEVKEVLWLPLLHWRNTSNKIGFSPIQRRISRQTKHAGGGVYQSTEEMKTSMDLAAFRLYLVLQLGRWIVIVSRKMLEDHELDRQKPGWRIGESLPDMELQPWYYQIETIEEGFPKDSLLDTLMRTSNSNDPPSWDTTMEKATENHSIKSARTIGMARKQDDITVTDHELWTPRSGRGGYSHMDDRASKVVSMRKPYTTKQDTPPLQKSLLPINICTCMPPQPTNPMKIEIFYDDITNTLEKLHKNDITLVIGNFNAKIVQGINGEVIRPFGIGECNERGERLK